MAPRTLSPAAERVLSAAMELFAAQGYHRTSVGEIQEAAGLTFGSGALYKHFDSKEAVLAEGIERFVDHARDERQLLNELDGSDLTADLRVIATSAMPSFAHDRDALRIVWRDLEAFPSLQARVRSERIRASFEQFAQWVGQQAEEDQAAAGDAAALSAVALSSLAFFQLLRFLLDDTPGGVSETRFVEAWVKVFATALSAAGE